MLEKYRKLKKKILKVSFQSRFKIFKFNTENTLSAEHLIKVHFRYVKEIYL